MKKIINYKLVTVLITVLALAACYKDKGNYDYTSIDEVTIDTTGFGGRKSIKRFDTLTIEPVVKYKGEVVNATHPQFPELQFVWTMYPNANARGNDLRTLDSTVRLHKMMDQPELFWDVRLTVTNKLTGVKAYAIFSVSMEPALAEGWMVLYEKNGGSDVAMIANDRINRTVVKEQVFYDLYQAFNGHPIKGKPGRIAYSLAAIRPTNIYVQTDQDVVSVFPTSFQTKATPADSLFWTRPATLAPAYIQATDGRKELLMNNNKVHKIDYTAIVSGRQAFDDGAANSYGSLAPWGATAVAGAFAAVVYDQTNRRFLKLNNTGAELQPFATAQSGAAFDVNNVGMEFLLADIGRNYEEQMVMKETATGKYFLLTANFKLGENAKIGTGKYEMSNCPEIATVNSVSAGGLGEIFFYSGGTDKVYQFKYTSGVTQTAWTAPAGEKVTCIKVQKSYNTNPGAAAVYDPKNANKVLYIATYNEATATGKLYEMDFDPSNGTISTANQRAYSGFGKIKSMSWKPYIL